MEAEPGLSQAPQQGARRDLTLTDVNFSVTIHVATDLLYDFVKVLPEVDLSITIRVPLFRAMLPCSK